MSDTTAVQSTRARHRASRLGAGLLVTLGAGAAALGFAAAATAAEPAPSLSSRDFACLVEPSQTVKVGAAVNGLLAKVEVDRGDVVRAGQILARLESGVEEAALALAEVRASNDAQMESNRVKMEFLQRKHRRYEQLKDGPAMSQAKLDEAETDAKVGEHAEREANLNMQVAKLEAQRAHELVNQRLVLSPINGVVTERVMSGGEYRADQQYILKLARLDPLHVEVFLPAALYPEVKIGDQAEVTPEVRIGDRHVASISVIDNVMDAASGTFGVRLVLPNPANALPAGLKCKLRFLPRELAATGSSPRP